MGLKDVEEVSILKKYFFKDGLTDNIVFAIIFGGIIGYYVWGDFIPLNPLNVFALLYYGLYIVPVFLVYTLLELFINRKKKTTPKTASILGAGWGVGSLIAHLVVSLPCSATTATDCGVTGTLRLITLPASIMHYVIDQLAELSGQNQSLFPLLFLAYIIVPPILGAFIVNRSYKLLRGKK